LTKEFSIIVALLIWQTACNEAPEKEPGFSAKSVGEIEKMKLTDIKGQEITLKQYRGKTIFINFWATWCRPCIQEMPSIAAAQDMLQNEKIIFLLASSESAEQIEEFGKAHDYKITYVRIENSEEMNIQVLPATFIFNGKGNLSFSETGSRKWDEKNNIDLILKIAKEND
jgi:thiol-disulfide isomerase/thioredoxin